jgi:hypothetical protein
MKAIISCGLLALGLIGASGLFGQFYYAAAKTQAEVQFLQQKDQQAWIKQMSEQQLQRLLKPRRQSSPGWKA